MRGARADTAFVRNVFLMSWLVRVAVRQVRGAGSHPAEGEARGDHPHPARLEGRARDGARREFLCQCPPTAFGVRHGHARGPGRNHDLLTLMLVIIILVIMISLTTATIMMIMVMRIQRGQVREHGDVPLPPGLPGARSL